MSTSPGPAAGSNDGTGVRGWLSATGARDAVLAGLVAVVVIAIAAIIALAVADEIDAQLGTIATGAFGVVGTIVGAYFGINVGTRAGAQGKDEAKAAASQATALAYQSQVDASVARAQAHVLASHLPEGKATDVNQECQAEAEAAAERVRDTWRRAGSVLGA